MFDDDVYSNLLNSLGTITTETDEENETTSSYSPSSYNTTTTYNPYTTDTSYQDDYSVTPNYEEQSSYESSSRAEETAETTTTYVSSMHTPMIQREEKAVVLTKTRQKIYLHARMKIAIAMFVTIVSALLFVTVFNFVNAGRLNSSLADKQVEINQLQASIMELQKSYNEMSSDQYIIGEVQTPVDEGGLGFKDAADSTITLSVGDVYTEPVIEELPSNWFNDVCDFFSNLFAA
ncbi:MAG: hypothetical protein IKD36_00470 [Clostridia bacterium]|nr:hypothetical protein [Clostridia bacterium]